MRLRANGIDNAAVVIPIRAFSPAKGNALGIELTMSTDDQRTDLWFRRMYEADRGSVLVDQSILNSFGSNRKKDAGVDHRRRFTEAEQERHLCRFTAPNRVATSTLATRRHHAVTSSRATHGDELRRRRRSSNLSVPVGSWSILRRRLHHVVVVALFRNPPPIASAGSISRIVARSHFYAASRRAVPALFCTISFSSNGFPPPCSLFHMDAADRPCDR
jgi:hypothetical protein